MATQNKENINTEDIKWLSQHRQSIEHRNRMLKGAVVFYICFVLALGMITSAILSFYLFVVFILALAIAILDSPDKYAIEMAFGTISGFIIGIIITLIYLTPIANVVKAPISMQVFYPNNPNLTITQNCTAFSVSSSGYLNGQPINLTNTTNCNLPQNMAINDSNNPFKCNITNKTIDCTSIYSNITWKGTILNVSKRYVK